MSALLFNDIGKPRRLAKIRIAEISSVVSPANEHARMVLCKRADERKTDMEPHELIRKAGVLAEVAMQGQADRLRKANPELSEAQAYSRVYSAPANVELRRAERMLNGFGDYAKRAPTDISEPGQIDFGKAGEEARQWAFNRLQELAVDLNRREPSLSHAQCFARCYASPENVEFRKAERAANGPAIDTTY